MRIFAITTRGLEEVCAQEMAGIPGLALRGSAYRRVLADYDGPLPTLLALRTVDDVYLHLDTWTGIARQREALERVKQASARIDLKAAAALLAGERETSRPPVFSVTASFVGRRNYSADEIKQAAAEGIAARAGWLYTGNDAPGAFNLRLFIEGEQALVGLRLSDYPLHQRPYKQTNIPGSTKPSVAAALVRLAQVAPGQTVLDPCCGAGTILIEAALAGASARGGDNDPQAVAASLDNSRRASVPVTIQRWDARCLPLPGQSVARIISNLPWGRQASVEAGLAEYYQAITGEMRRVLAPGGRIVLLANAPRQVFVPGAALKQQIEISLFGQTPVIMIFE